MVLYIIVPQICSELYQELLDQTIDYVDTSNDSFFHLYAERVCRKSLFCIHFLFAFIFGIKFRAIQPEDFYGPCSLPLDKAYAPYSPAFLRCSRYLSFSLCKPFPISVYFFDIVRNTVEQPLGVYF